MTAFVLGNGESRQGIDLSQLILVGSVYGCNALYRDFTPSVLVATDRPISEEIQRSGYAQNNHFYTRHVVPGSGARPVPRKYHGFSSGPIALALAAMTDANPIYLLGFDLGPNAQGQFNNIYASTEYYKPAGSHPTYTGNWVDQISTIARDFPTRILVRVHGPTTAEIPQFARRPNMQKMALNDFAARINNTKDL